MKINITSSDQLLGKNLIVNVPDANGEDVVVQVTQYSARGMLAAAENRGMDLVAFVDGNDYYLSFENDPHAFDQEKWVWSFYQERGLGPIIYDININGAVYSVTSLTGTVWHAKTMGRGIGFVYTEYLDAMRACARDAGRKEEDVYHTWEYVQGGEPSSDTLAEFFARQLQKLSDETEDWFRHAVDNLCLMADRIRPVIIEVNNVFCNEHDGEAVVGFGDESILWFNRTGETRTYKALNRGEKHAS